MKIGVFSARWFYIFMQMFIYREIIPYFVFLLWNLHGVNDIKKKKKYEVKNIVNKLQS